jgi:hypothetical protein
MYATIGVCIVAVALASPSADQGTDSSVIFSTDFGVESDRDYNAWPDGWTRRGGPDYPPYVKARLDFDAVDDTRGALRIDLNGGQVLILSPPIAIDALHCYALRGVVKTQGLVHDRAWLTLTLLDGEKRSLQTYESAPCSGTSDWKELSIDRIDGSQGEPRFAVIGLRIDHAAEQDLRGTVWFNHLRLSRRPLIRLEANNRLLLYDAPDAAELTLSVWGLIEPDAQVALDVRDHLDSSVSSETLPLRLEPMPAGGANAAGRKEYRGRLAWRPRLPECGRYQVQAKVFVAKEPVLETILPLFRIEPGGNAGGQFGWSLPEGAVPLTPEELVALLTVAGCGRVKLPLWGEQTDDRFKLVERLTRAGVNCVGILANPPAQVRQKLANPLATTAADIFTAPAELWSPSISSLLIRLGLYVECWQLGGDHDRSFVGYPQLAGRLRGLRQQLEASGQSLRLGIGWDWRTELPEEVAGSLQFVSLSTQSALTTDELLAALQTRRSPRPSRWVQLEPRSLAGQSDHQRGCDLVRQMAAAAAFGAGAIFCADPFDPVRGLIDSAGRPTELFLAWRQAARMLSGATYLGHMELSQRSSNYVFLRDQQALMVAWSASPFEEPMYLGDDVTACDLYGKRQVVPRQGDVSVLSLGPEPRWIAPLDAAVTRWRLATHLDQPKLPSIPGKSLPQSLKLTNTFARPVSGRAKLVAPRGWVPRPASFEFRLDAGHEHVQPLTILLPYDVESGPQPLRVQFELSADRDYRFEAICPLEVGLGDLTIALDTRLDSDGTLAIQGQVTNRADQPVRLDCSLFAPERRRQVLELVVPAQGQASTILRLDRGRDLVGQTIWLRATEIGGRRVFNYRFVAQP